MKIIEIEKELNLQGVVDILELTMQDNFTYQQEADGVRCVGPFYINGRYSTLNEVRDFQEVYEFDVFAGNDKLDGMSFSIEYDGYDYSILNKIILYLHFKVHGIKGEEIEPITTEEELIPYEKTEEEPVELLSFVDESGQPWQSTLSEAMELEERQPWTKTLAEAMGLENVVDEVEEEKVVEETPVVIEKQDIEPVVQKEVINKEENCIVAQDNKDIPVQEEEGTATNINDVANLSMMEELFEDKDNVITSYSFVVIKANDTYASIANRYQVEEEALRKANSDKELRVKNLLVLPYIK